MTISVLVTSTIVAIALFAAVWLWIARKRRKTPEERERARRLSVNTMGRLAEGALVDDPSGDIPSLNSDLLFYEYRVGGMEYVAAQDVSTLSHLMDRASCRPGIVVAVKYDPRRPSNSIVICEQWNGLFARRSHAPESVPATENG